jgi:phage repressor protein C with HTH and peptisase S24 domain
VPKRAPIERNRQSGTAGPDQAGFTARLQLVVQQWPSTDRLAKATGVSPSAFRKWLKGVAEPSRTRLVALAEAAGVNVSWLAQGEGAEPDLRNLAARAHSSQSADSADAAANPNIANFLVLPKRREAAAAGAGPQTTREPLEFIGFRHDWLQTTFGRSPGDLILEIAVGESMEPTIRNGDLLLVDTTDRTFQNFGIYVIDVRGERLVKRIQRNFDGSLILISDNRIYQPEAISAALAKEVRGVGRVIWRGGQA